MIMKKTAKDNYPELLHFKVFTLIGISYSLVSAILYNLNEAQLTIRSLKKHNLTNTLKHIDDGEEAMDYIFGEGMYAGKSGLFNSELILLHLKLPKVNGLDILRRLKSDKRTKEIPCGGSYFV